MVVSPDSVTLSPGARPGRLGALAPLDLDALFNVKIKRVRSSLFYKLAMPFVALGMLALPLLYLALIAALGYFGVYYYAIHAYPLQTIRDHSISTIAKFYMLVLYLSPLVGCIVAILFMLKPFLARPPRGIHPRALRREDEPLLFAFIERLCRLLGAPVPARIEVSCPPGAAAGPAHGLLSLFTRRLCLEIGLSSVAGMNLSQFAGVLAHELGHFSQGGGMLFNNVIKRLNLWFARVVYERDDWDETLEKLCKSGDSRLLPVFYVSRLFIWLSRRVLWVLMVCGALLSGFLSRMREYGADRFEVRIAGSEEFERTFLRLLELDLAWRKTMSDLHHAFHEKRLGDNLPELIVANLQTIPAAERDAYLEAVLGRKVGLFSTHPSEAQRISRAFREDDPGVITDERPATDLFLNFEQICQVASMDHYAMALGPALAQARLVPTRELIARQQDLETALSAADSFFGDCLDVDRPLRLRPADLAPPADPRATALALKRSRDLVAQLAPEARKGYESLQRLWSLEVEAYILERLSAVRLSYQPKGFKIKGIENLGAFKAALRSQNDEALAAIVPYEDALCERFVTALNLLHTPQLQARLPESRMLLQQAHALVEAMDAYASVNDSIDELRRTYHYLEQTLNLLKKNAADENDQELLRTITRPLVRLMNAIQGALSLAPYPFADDGQPGVSLGRLLLDAPPDSKDAYATLLQGKEMLDRLNKFFYRCAGELGRIVDAVERALDFPPLPRPE